MNPLKSQMDELTGNVTAVDLTPRVHATARKLRKTRVMAAGVATLALATGATFTSAFAFPEDHGAAGDLRGRFVFAGATEGLGAGDTVEYQTTPAGAVDFSVVTWIPGQDPVTYDLDEPAFETTVEVSPDGEWLSYVGNDFGVHLVKLDSGEVTELPGGAAGDYPDRHVADDYSEFDNAPVWSPESDRLWIDTGNKGAQRYGFVDIDTGEFTATRAPAGSATRVIRTPDDSEQLVSARTNSDKENEIVSVPAGPEGDEKVVPIGPFEEGHISDLTAATTDGSRLCLTLSDTGGDIPLSGAEGCEKIVRWQDNGESPHDTPSTYSPKSEAVSNHLLIGTGDRFIEQQPEFGYRLKDGKGSTIDKIEPPQLITDSVIKLQSYTPPSS